MFGNKQKEKEIEQLKRDVESWEAVGRMNDKMIEEMRASVSQGLHVADTLRETLGKFARELDEKDAQVEVLNFALSESKGMNQALEDENRDLVRQVELYRALLAQIQVNVTLPARKR